MSFFLQLLIFGQNLLARLRLVFYKFLLWQLFYYSSQWAFEVLVYSPLRLSNFRPDDVPNCILSADIIIFLAYWIKTIIQLLVYRSVEILSSKAALNIYCSILIWTTCRTFSSSGVSGVSCIYTDCFFSHLSFLSTRSFCPNQSRLGKTNR